MNDLISRQEAIRLYCREHCGWEPEKCPLKYERDGAEDCSYVRFLKELPSVQPEQKRGKWIRLSNDLAQCSECKDYIDNAISCGYNYCPNCGAEMGE